MFGSDGFDAIPSVGIILEGISDASAEGLSTPGIFWISSAAHLTCPVRPAHGFAWRGNQKAASRVTGRYSPAPGSLPVLALAALPSAPQEGVPRPGCAWAFQQPAVVWHGRRALQLDTHGCHAAPSRPHAPRLAPWSGSLMRVSRCPRGAGGCSGGNHACGLSLALRFCPIPDRPFRWVGTCAH